MTRVTAQALLQLQERLSESTLTPVARKVGCHPTIRAKMAAIAYIKGQISAWDAIQRKLRSLVWHCSEPGVSLIVSLHLDDDAQERLGLPHVVSEETLKESDDPKLDPLRVALHQAMYSVGLYDMWDI